MLPSSTPTAVPCAGRARTSRRPSLRLLGVARIMAGVLVALAGGARAVPACVGDCNGDGEVTVDELVTGVHIALESAAVDSCPSLDVDRDGLVTVDEMLSGVDALLKGCAPTPSGDSRCDREPNPDTDAQPDRDLHPEPAAGGADLRRLSHLCRVPD